MSKTEEKPSHYPTVDANPDFVALEKEILEFWKREGIFQKSVDKNKSAGEQYVFYDGPPFANGLPHYGHLLTGYVKDLVARYQTMRGRVVERRFGWDCHGLPAEMGAEKELGISGRQAIIEYGIGKFNDYCRENVMRYASEWERYVDRQGRWVDFQNDYKTMDKDFMESVLWAFSELYKKGLIYESYRVMPYSWAAETPLSNFETRLDNATREREDKAITVAFELDEVPKFEKLGVPPETLEKFTMAKKFYLLGWTTTPWTLPSNLALAVSRDLAYVVHVEGDRAYIATVDGIKKTFGIEYGYGSQGQSPDESSEEAKKRESNHVPYMMGGGLEGLTYKPLFPYFKDHLGSFRILDGSDFIEEGSGTGVVHLAPGFGEDDQKCCERNGISIVCPVDDKGGYTEEVYDIPFHCHPREGGDPEAQAEDMDSRLRGNDAVLSLKGLNVIAENRLEETDKARHISEKNVRDFGLANMRIVRWLKANNRLIKDEPFKHNYPHCWRTDTPIIYRALPSWYVKVSAFKDRAVELNQRIHWIPEHTRDGAMGHMLGSAPDWSISRNRFWGCPIPVWKSPSGKIKVFGSIAEIEEAWNKSEASRPSVPTASEASPIAERSSAEQGHKKITDLHRPFIDEIIIREDGEEYRRVEEVLDCWFESGSMPYAQLHYPFENAEKFKGNYPGDFITEYIGQTRGWFNTLIMLATALFDQEPFKNCICHGVVIDEETGLKYSKRLKNYKDPMEVFDTFGADALRWLMVSSGVMRGHDLGVDPEGKFIRDVVRLNIKPIWNAYNFFTLYANADGLKAEFSTDSDNVMDQYILAKCRSMVEGIQAALDGYDTPAACEAVTKFVEVLNNWYIRRSRPRFWESEKTADKQAAYNTLYTVLHTLCRAAAPLLPFTLEAVFRGLTNNASSVHLQDFPSEMLSDSSVISFLEAEMDWVRDACNAGLSVRNASNIRTRQPIEKVVIYSEADFWVENIGDNYYTQLIADELNVKKVEISRSLESVATKRLEVKSNIVGKRLPEKMKQILPASKKGEWKILEGDNGYVTKVEVAGEILANNYSYPEYEEFSIKLEPKKDIKGAAPLSTNDALVVLDLTLTPELIAEGVARDVVRMVQESRKKADLHISDKISLIITAPESVGQAVSGFKDYIAGQVLAESVTVGSSAAEFSYEHELEGEKVVISFSKVA